MIENRALNKKHGASCWNRTSDLLFTRQTLCHWANEAVQRVQNGGNVIEAKRKLATCTFMVSGEESQHQARIDATTHQDLFALFQVSAHQLAGSESARLLGKVGLLLTALAPSRLIVRQIVELDLAQILNMNTTSQQHQHYNKHEKNIKTNNRSAGNLLGTLCKDSIIGALTTTETWQKRKTNGEPE